MPVYQRTEIIQKWLPILWAFVMKNSFHSVEKVEPVLWHAKAFLNKLKIGLQFVLLYKSLPAKLPHVLWRPVTELNFEAPYWLTPVFPSWILGVAMVMSPPLRPCTRWRAAAVFILSPRLSFLLTKLAASLDNLAPFLLQILNLCCHTLLSQRDMCS